MRNLRPLDRALLAILLTIWAVCFAIGVRSFGHPTVLPPLAVRTAGASGYPILSDIAPWGDAETGLRRGDRLIRVGDTDLRGASVVGFYARFVAEARYGEPLPSVIYERGGQRGETRLPTPITTQPPLLASLGGAFTALFLAFRAAASPFARALARASAVGAVATASPVTGGIAANYVGLAVAGVAWSLVLPLLLDALLLFLHRERPASAWARLWPWLFASVGPLTVSMVTGFPIDRRLGIPLGLAVLLACLAVMLTLVTRAYRRMDAIERRQIRWLALGFYAGLAPVVTVLALMICDGVVLGEWRRFQPLLIPSASFWGLVPLSFLFASGRYNLFDVDRLLSAAASYHLLLVLLLGGALVAVPRIAEALSGVIGVDPGAGQVALSLALAALVVPAQRRLRPQIDRLFFKERYALDRGIEELLRELSSCATAQELTERAGAALHRLLRPEACVVYALVGETYVPVFVEGRTVPPAFHDASPLIRTLAERHRPLALSDAGRRPDDASLGPFDRAALETLGAEVVVPVHREELAAFLCLGPKRSGDVYTATDLALLTAVAEAMSQQLRHFDEQQVIREAREMQDSLRRYVPGAIAEQIASGADLGPCERQVSVLFVDLRGYTSFAEPRRAAEIFSTVNRYTQAVSEIVRKHGGSVVEFNGDGMMAVFGAPRDLPRKERAAVEAGREMASAVGALSLADPGDAGAVLAVGVGVATGAAFVGNIQAADRMIWSAIGNTTNLAARLQGLTRDLDVAMVIDAATWQALDRERGDFARHEAIAIRGRRQVQDLYSLRLVPLHADHARFAR